MKTIEDWRFADGGTIIGLIDGERTRTSPVAARNPETNVIQTRSGSVYQLGKISDQSLPESIMWSERGWVHGPDIPRVDDL